jgi:hypothetical protein
MGQATNGASTKSLKPSEVDGRRLVNMAWRYVRSVAAAKVASVAEAFRADTRGAARTGESPTRILYEPYSYSHVTLAQRDVHGRVYHAKN